MDTGDRYFPDAYATWVVTPMFRIESLIMKAYQAKEDEKKWNVACKAVKPPLSDAKMYFGDINEVTERIGKQKLLVWYKGITI